MKPSKHNMAVAGAVAACGFGLGAIGPAAHAAGCDAKTAQAAVQAQMVSEKFSSTARMCGDEPQLLTPTPYVRQVAPVEDHSQHLSMYDAVEYYAPDDTLDEAPGGRSRIPATGAWSPLDFTQQMRGPAAVRAMALMPQFQAVAHAAGIDYLLLHAIAHVESRHNPAAVSPAGAIGMMQIMPATARRFGVMRPQVELRDPRTSLQVSASYLKTLQERFGNNLTLVLAAYNAGEGAVEKYGRRVPPYPETRGYVTDVMAMYRALRAAASPERVAALLFAGR